MYLSCYIKLKCKNVKFKISLRKVVKLNYLKLNHLKFTLDLFGEVGSSLQTS